MVKEALTSPIRPAASENSSASAAKVEFETQLTAPLAVLYLIVCLVHVRRLWDESIEISRGISADVCTSLRA